MNTYSKLGFATLLLLFVALVAGRPQAALAQAHGQHYPAGAAAHAVPDAAAAQLEDGVQVVHIAVGPMGYTPGQIELQADVPARLVFRRTAEGGCTDKVQIPEFGVEPTALSLNEPVAIEITPKKGGTFTFACGMNMAKGTLVVRP